MALPLVLPPTVLGYYLLVLIGRASPIGKVWEYIFGSPLVFTWKAAVIAALLHALPLLVMSARAALESVDRSYERAARNLGASEWRLFWRITLPLLVPGIMSGTALAFIVSFDDFTITQLVAGPGQTTLPLFIWNQIRRPMTPEINAISTILLLVSIAFISRRRKASK